MLNLIGKKFNRLTVLQFVKKDSHHRNYWGCRCDCGRIKIVRQDCLIGKDEKKLTLSCGCLHKEQMAKQKTTHGLWKNNRNLYAVWRAIKDRCLNSNTKGYCNYGLRGINICNEWVNNFECFYNWAIKNGYKTGLTIDRINVNGNYCPENCRWVDNIVQQNNRRNNHRITYNGETKTLAEWSKEKGLGKEVLSSRLYKYGWSVEKALTTPTKKGVK